MQPARLVGDFSPDQQARLARQADDAILGRSLPAYAAYFALGLIFVLGFGYHREHPQLAATFLVVILVIAVARVGLHYRGGPLRDRDPKRWRLTFGAGVFLSIATWTVFLCYVIASAGAHRQSFFLLLCSTGLSAGATNTLSPNLRLIRLHLIIAVPPVIIACLLISDPLRLPLAGIITFQLIFHLAESRRLNRELWERLVGEMLLQERQRANELLAAAVEHAAEAIAVIDADGNVSHANSAYDEAGGPDLVAALDVGAAEVWRGDVQVRARDGALRHYEATLSPVGDAGAATRRVLVARDVTERDRAEEEHTQMREQLILAERLASMGTLAAGVAHEINNPLAYVTGNLEHVSRCLPELAPHGDPALLAELTEALVDAREGAERVRRIVQDLKSFSRSDAHRGPIDAVAVLELAAKMAANELRPRARLVKAYDAIPLVDANESQLGQVFLGLIVNAAQAIEEGHPEGNEIRLSARCLADGSVAIEVQDTGAGIPSEIRGRIFEPFFTTKPVGVGTGLGLSICHGIVKSLGGELTFHSVVGGGSTFRVRLAPSPAETDEVPVVAPRSRPDKTTVLVVDDEPKIGAIVKRALTPDYAVVVETSGRAALERIRAGEHFDALVCDLMMPEMTGMDLYDALGALAPALRDRTIFLSGGAFTPHARDFLDRVPNLRLDKPFDRETLDAALARVLGEQRRG